MWPHLHQSDDPISFSEAGARDWNKKQEVPIWIQFPKIVVAAGRIESIYAQQCGLVTGC